MTRHLTRLTVTVALCATPMPALAAGETLQELAGRMYRDATGGYLSEIKTWLGMGADINYQLPYGGKTALMGAVSGGQYAIEQFLIDQGADLGLTDDTGRTALDWAGFYGDRKMVALLTAAAGKSTAAPAAAPPLKSPAPAPTVTAAPNTAPTARGTTPRAWTDKNRWPAFPHFRVGELVQFWTPTGWRRGVVEEVRSPQDRKYLVSQLDQPTWKDYYAWGEVAHVARSPYWTGFFVGEWRLGEVMAVNTRTDGTDVYREFSYAAASEALRINGDGSYLWKAGGKVTRGTWTAAVSGPGVVVKDAQGVAWTLVNHTNAIEESIRKLQTARLYAPGKMSIAANRPVAR